jgi:hypothetical protein
MLVGLPNYLVRQLQSVHLRRSDQITDALDRLHWLRVTERIQYKIAVLTFKVLQGTAPRYLFVYPICRADVLSDRPVLPVWSFQLIGSLQ